MTYVFCVARFTSRRFVFTLNNPKHTLCEWDFKSWGATYVVFQEEIGESGTHHLQGYIEMPKPVRPTSFTGLEGAHFEKANGTGEQCTAYCTKEDTRVGEPVVWGKMSRGAGSRTDIVALRDAVRDGKRGRALYDDDGLVGAAVKYQRGLAALEQCYSVAPERGDIRVVFHYGPPGTGKTHCCHSAEGMNWRGKKNCLTNDLSSILL